MKIAPDLAADDVLSRIYCPGPDLRKHEWQFTPPRDYSCRHCGRVAVSEDGGLLVPPELEGQFLEIGNARIALTPEMIAEANIDGTDVAGEAIEREFVR